MKTSKVLTLAMSAGLLLAVQTTAKAHIIIEDMKGRAGYNEMLTLIVPHGCGADPTTAVRMKVPEEISLVVPHPGDGWDVEIKKRKTDKPVMREGRPITEVVDEIVWSGNTLPSEELGLFKFMAGLPRTPGKVLYFKTIQVCGEKEDRWVETHDNDAEYWRVWLLETPAPFAVIVEPEQPQLGVDMQTLAKARAEMSGAK
ncbi:MAG: YcnI family protein [Rhodospirillaceae bacterium]